MYMLFSWLVGRSGKFLDQISETGYSTSRPKNSLPRGGRFIYLKNNSDEDAA